MTVSEDINHDASVHTQTKRVNRTNVTNQWYMHLRRRNGTKSRRWYHWNCSNDTKIGVDRWLDVVRCQAEQMEYSVFLLKIGDTLTAENSSASTLQPSRPTAEPSTYYTKIVVTSTSYG